MMKRRVYQRWQMLCSFLLVMILLPYFKKNTVELEESALSERTIPVVSLEDVTAFRYNADGEKEVMLSSARAAYYADTQETVYERPQLQHYPEKMDLTAQTATNFQGQYLVLKGEVVATRRGEQNHDDLRLESDEMEYVYREHYVDIPRALVLKTPNSITHAIGARWHLNQNLFILNKNIRSHYAPHFSRADAVDNAHLRTK